MEMQCLFCEVGPEFCEHGSANVTNRSVYDRSVLRGSPLEPVEATERGEWLVTRYQLTTVLPPVTDTWISAVINMWCCWTEIAQQIVAQHVGRLGPLLSRTFYSAYRLKLDSPPDGVRSVIFYRGLLQTHPTSLKRKTACLLLTVTVNRCC